MTDQNEIMSGGAWAARARITVAALIMTIDGFASFSLSLMAPMMSRDLQIPNAALGPIFASAMAGMTVGAFTGGALADRFGRLAVLLVAIILFGVGSMTMPLVDGSAAITLNRFAAGVGFGAVGPIVTSLLNRADSKPPTEFAIAIVWSGVAMGGCLAALFNYLFTAAYGWKLIFFVGGFAPFPLAICAYAVFRGTQVRGAAKIATGDAKPKPRMTALFTHGQAWRTLVVAGMFFFGFVSTSIFVFWLPTILNHRHASELMISVSFAGMNGGAVLVIPLLGFLASYGPPGRLRNLAWIAVAMCGFGAAIATSYPDFIALLAIVGFTIGTAVQTLSIALANEMHRTRGLQATSVGFMITVGRLGPFVALGISGSIATLSGQETMVFALAGITACIAALLSVIATRQTAESVKRAF